MRILVDPEEMPFTRDKVIQLTEDGEEKVFPIKVEFNQFTKKFVCIIPQSFPKELIKVIFGPSAEVVGKATRLKRKRKVKIDGRLVILDF